MRIEQTSRHSLTLIALSFLTLLYAAGTFRQIAPRTNKPDFSIYYVSAWELRHHVDPYTADFRNLARTLHLDVGDIDRQAETPPFLLSFEVLTLFSPTHAYWTWLCLGVLALIGSLKLLLDNAALDLRARLLLTVAALWYVPLADTFRYAQSELIVLFLLALAINFLSRSREIPAAIAIAVAVLLRAFPLVMLGFFLLERRWKALAVAMIAMAAGVSLVTFAVGLKTCLSFLGAIGLSRHRTLFGYTLLSGPGNLALISAVSRLFWRTLPLPLTPAMDLCRQVVGALAVVAVLIISSAVSLRSVGPERWRRCFGLWVATMLMICPVLWLHYVTIMLIPLLLIASESIAKARITPATRLAAASYLLLLITRGPLITLYGSLPLSLLKILAEGGFVSVLLAYSAACRFAWESRFADSTQEDAHLQVAA